jgi:L-threonylcarbamoyladenylate synthase
MIKNNWQKAEEILKNDGVVVLPTDTIYGIVGCAMSKKVVERIYKIKGRDENKPFIVLITSYKDLRIFGVKIDEQQAKILAKFWPGKVTVVLPCLSNKFEYLHRGEKSIAFRMIGPKNKNLFNLLKKVGPIVAPSANPQYSKHAETITQAKIYFKDKVDFYLSCGTKKGKSSTLVKFENDKLIVLRQGEYIIKN